MSRELPFRNGLIPDEAFNGLQYDNQQLDDLAAASAEEHKNYYETAHHQNFKTRSQYNKDTKTLYIEPIECVPVDGKPFETLLTRCLDTYNSINNDAKKHLTEFLIHSNIGGHWSHIRIKINSTDKTATFSLLDPPIWYDFDGYKGAEHTETTKATSEEVRKLEPIINNTLKGFTLSRGDSLKESIQRNTACALIVNNIKEALKRSGNPLDWKRSQTYLKEEEKFGPSDISIPKLPEQRQVWTHEELIRNNTVRIRQGLYRAQRADLNLLKKHDQFIKKKNKLIDWGITVGYDALIKRLKDEYLNQNTSDLQSRLGMEKFIYPQEQLTLKEVQDKCQKDQTQFQFSLDDIKKFLSERQYILDPAQEKTLEGNIRQEYKRKNGTRQRDSDFVKKLTQLINDIYYIQDKDPYDLDKSEKMGDDTEATTALDRAIKKDRPKIVETLLARGADPEHLTPQNKAALEQMRVENPNIFKPQQEEKEEGAAVEMEVEKTVEEQVAADIVNKKTAPNTETNTTIIDNAFNFSPVAFAGTITEDNFMDVSIEEGNILDLETLKKSAEQLQKEITRQYQERVTNVFTGKGLEEEMIRMLFVSSEEHFTSEGLEAQLENAATQAKETAEAKTDADATAEAKKVADAKAAAAAAAAEAAEAKAAAAAAKAPTPATRKKVPRIVPKPPEQQKEERTDIRKTADTVLKLLRTGLEYEIAQVAPLTARGAAHLLKQSKRKDYTIYETTNLVSLGQYADNPERKAASSKQYATLASRDIHNARTLENPIIKTKDGVYVTLPPTALGNNIQNAGRGSTTGVDGFNGYLQEAFWDLDNILHEHPELRKVGENIEIWAPVNTGADKGGHWIDIRIKGTLGKDGKSTKLEVEVFDPIPSFYTAEDIGHHTEAIYQAINTSRIKSSVFCDHADTRKTSEGHKYVQRDLFCGGGSNRMVRGAIINGNPYQWENIDLGEAIDINYNGKGSIIARRADVELLVELGDLAALETLEMRYQGIDALQKKRATTTTPQNKPTEDRAQTSPELQQIADRVILLQDAVSDEGLKTIIESAIREEHKTLRSQINAQSTDNINLTDEQAAQLAELIKEGYVAQLFNKYLLVPEMLQSVISSIDHSSSAEFTVGDTEKTLDEALAEAENSIAVQAKALIRDQNIANTAFRNFAVFKQNALKHTQGKEDLYILTLQESIKAQCQLFIINNFTKKGLPPEIIRETPEEAAAAETEVETAETEVAVETAETEVETARAKAAETEARAKAAETKVAVETAETATTPLKLRPSATQKKLEAEAAARALAEANAEAEAEAEAAARAEATARAAAQQAQNEERRRQEEGEKTQTQDARNNGQQTGNGNDTPPRVRDSDKKQKNKHVSFASTVRDEDGTSASLRTPAAPHKPPAKSHTNPPAPRQPQAESHTMRNVAAFMITIIGIAAGIAILLTSGSLLGLIPLIVGVAVAVAVGGITMQILEGKTAEKGNNKTNTPTQHHETSRSQNHAATLANQRKVNPPSPSKQP